MKIRFFLLIGFCISLFSQAQTFKYNQNIHRSNTQSDWFQIKLNADIQDKTASDFSDIRLYSTANLSKEIPYVILSSYQKDQRSKLPLEQLNESYIADNYTITLKNTSQKTINELELDFVNDAFDYFVRLEGSMDQKNWQHILNDYRILKISSETMNYHYSTLNFPSANFLYFRLHIANPKKVKLHSASFFANTQSMYERDSLGLPFQQTNDPKKNSTKLDVQLQKRQKVSQLSLTFSDDYFQRPIYIEYATDSVRTEKGLFYAYQPLLSSVVSSKKINRFEFEPRDIKHFRIFISNFNDQALTVKTVSIAAPIIKIYSKQSTREPLILAYGKKAERKPIYDLEKFHSEIPQDAPSVIFAEMIENNNEIDASYTIDIKDIWMWILLIILILFLGIFAAKIMKD
jgi:hypothetical protein